MVLNDFLFFQSCGLINYDGYSFLHINPRPETLRQKSCQQCSWKWLNNGGDGIGLFYST